MFSRLTTWATLASRIDFQLGVAIAEGRALYSFNVADFMSLHNVRIASGGHHYGLILAQQQRYSVGEQMRRLLRLTGTKSAEQMRDSVEFLSVWGRGLGEQDWAAAS
jgi:hypothetical protein